MQLKKYQEKPLVKMLSKHQENPLIKKLLKLKLK